MLSLIAVREHLNECLQDYSVNTKNARNSLPINGYQRSTVIAERRGSRDERQRQSNLQERARENDVNGNAKRKLSTGEKIDLDFLRIIASRSAQASPSNVRIEEDEQGTDELENIEIVENKQFEEKERTRPEESEKNEDVSITEKVVASPDHVAYESVNGNNDAVSNGNNATSAGNDDASTTHALPMTDDDNVENINHDLEPSKKSSEVKIENSSEGLEESVQVKDVNGANRDGGDTTAEVANSLNAEQNGSIDAKETVGEAEEQEQQQMEQQQKHDKELDGQQQEKERYIQEEDNDKQQQQLDEERTQQDKEKEQHEHREQEQDEEKQQEQQQQGDDEQNEQQQMQDEEETNSSEKEQQDKEPSETVDGIGSGSHAINTTENASAVQETADSGNGDSNAQNNVTQEVTSENVNTKQHDEGLGSSGNVRTDVKQSEEGLAINDHES